jgi:catechol 2,3-dioxygenase-like lactoylglutathione lyase family enzyme
LYLEFSPYQVRIPGTKIASMHIKELHLLTADLNATVAFYTEKLGITLVHRNAETATLQAGNTIILFRETAEESYYHIAFDIPANQLKEAFEWISRRIPVLPVSAENIFAYFEAWNARSFYFDDNNGSILEFICRNDLRNESTVKFSSDSILYVSELGLVTDHVNELADEIMAKYDLPVYEKQPRLDNFTVLGTDSGLLIIVKSGRHWYPVDKPALPFPATIVFESAGKEHRLSLQ